MLLYSKKMKKYFGKHVEENAAAHLLLGIGAGFLLTYPLAQQHPVRWGAVFVIAGLLVHWRATR